MSNVWLVALIALASILPDPVWAHVESGATGDGGFLSGASHPIGGLDHVLAMIAVGLWGAIMGAPAIWLLPVTFPLVMAFGAVLGILDIPLPGVEVALPSPALCWDHWYCLTVAYPFPSHSFLSACSPFVTAIPTAPHCPISAYRFFMPQLCSIDRNSASNRYRPGPDVTLAQGTSSRTRGWRDDCFFRRLLFGPGLGDGRFALMLKTICRHRSIALLLTISVWCPPVFAHSGAPWIHRLVDGVAVLFSSGVFLINILALSLLFYRITD